MGVSIECDLRSLFGAVRDQGARPTCMAFAASDMHAAVRPGWVLLSCEYAYCRTLRRDGGHPEDGATAEGMLATIREDGQPPESQWCYLATLPADLAKWRPPANVGPLFRRASEFDAASVGGIVDQLNSAAPVLLTMCLSDAFFHPDTDGVIDSNEPPDPQRRHAVVVVGYGFRGKERMFLIRNSWGEAWGIDGYAWVSEQYLAARIDISAKMNEDLSNVSGNTAKAELRSGMA